MNIFTRFPLIRSILWFCLFLFGAVALALMVMPIYARPAASYLVNTLADNTTNGDGFCTLGEAILAANNVASNDCGTASSSDDTISFSVNGTVRLNTVLPNVAAGAGKLTIDGGNKIILSGDSDNNNVGDVRVLWVDLGADLTLQNLTISRGKADTLIGGYFFGGGVFNQGVLTTNNVHFQDNHADYGGALYTDGTATLERTYFSRSQADIGGGAIDNAGTLHATQVSFYGSSAVDLGGGILNFGVLTLG